LIFGSHLIDIISALGCYIIFIKNILADSLIKNLFIKDKIKLSSISYT
jgi:hypothetical protein